MVNKIPVVLTKEEDVEGGEEGLFIHAQVTSNKVIPVI